MDWKITTQPTLTPAKVDPSVTEFFRVGLSIQERLSPDDKPSFVLDLARAWVDYANPKFLTPPEKDASNQEEEASN